MEMSSKIVFAGSSKSWTSKAAPLGDAHLQNVLRNRTIPCSSISVQCPWCQASSTYRFQQRWRWNSRLPPRDSGKKSSGFCTLQIGPFFWGGTWQLFGPKNPTKGPKFWNPTHENGMKINNNLCLGSGSSLEVMRTSSEQITKSHRKKQPRSKRTTKPTLDLPRKHQENSFKNPHSGEYFVGGSSSHP